MAVVAALVLMLMPSGEGDGAVLPPAAVNTIRWDLLLLFGGGFALGDAFKSSGLADNVGTALAGATMLVAALTLAAHLLVGLVTAIPALAPRPAATPPG